jgi:hypothetical protein
MLMFRCGFLSTGNVFSTGIKIWPHGLPFTLNVKYLFGNMLHPSAISSGSETMSSLFVAITSPHVKSHYQETRAIIVSGLLQSLKGTHLGCFVPLVFTQHDS